VKTYPRSVTRIPTLGIAPAFVTKPEAQYILGSPVLLKRAMHAKRLTIVRQGGRGRSTLIDYPSVQDVVQFIRSGGELPLLPSEARQPAKLATSNGGAR